MLVLLHGAGGNEANLAALGTSVKDTQAVLARWSHSVMGEAPTPFWPDDLECRIVFMLEIDTVMCRPFILGGDFVLRFRVPCHEQPTSFSLCGRRWVDGFNDS